MRKTCSVLALTACSLALGGCQALFGTPSLTSRTPAADAASLDMSDYFAARLEAGRMHLARSRPAQAVTAFRQASYDPAHAGRAYNGMGVAYAQMGREDLARRYFTMALAADPQDERFARNLARLEQAPIDRAERLEFAAATEQPSPAPPPEASTSEQRPAENPGLLRVSPREVRISSAAGLRSDKTVSTDRQQSTRTGVSVVTARTRPSQGYPVRIELPRAAAAARTAHPVRVEARASEQASYPVRIALSDVKVSRVDYPIRIELSDAD